MAAASTPAATRRTRSRMRSTRAFISGSGACSARASRSAARSAAARSIDQALWDRTPVRPTDDLKPFAWELRFAVALPVGLLPGDRSAFMVELRCARHDVVSECSGLRSLESETVALQQPIKSRTIDARQS